MSVSISEFEKAVLALKEAVDLFEKSLKSEPQNLILHKVIRDACIQRFEFCVELAWKTAIRSLGLDTKAPNPAIRDLAQNKLIDDTQPWFDLLTARNKTSHSYDEEIAKEVYAAVKPSLRLFDSLLSRLKK